MRLLRIPVKLSDGTSRPSTAWYVEWRSSKGTHRWAAYGDKRASRALGELLQALADSFEVGLGPTPDQLAAVACLPPKRQAILTQMKLIPRALTVPGVGQLGKQLEQYKVWLEAAECVPRHVQQVISAVRACAAALDVQSPSDLTARRVAVYLKDNRDAGWSYRNSNRRLSALKGFLNWLVRVGHLQDNPLRHLRKLQEEVDPRHRHAAFTPAEIRTLLAAVRPVSLDRYWVYRFAAETGFRAAEIRSLTVSSFDLSVPCVTVQAAFSRKRKRTATQPLAKRTARDLRRYFARHRPTDPAFRVPQRTAALMQEDLVIAGIAYETSAGFHDFHALRHTFITEAGRHARSFADLQSLARHSTPALTARYAHARYVDTREAVESLYELPTNPSPVRIRKKG